MNNDCLKTIFISVFSFCALVPQPGLWPWAFVFEAQSNNLSFCISRPMAANSDLSVYFQLELLLKKCWWCFESAFHWIIVKAVTKSWHLQVDHLYTRDYAFYPCYVSVCVFKQCWPVSRYCRRFNPKNGSVEGCLWKWIAARCRREFWHVLLLTLLSWNIHRAYHMNCADFKWGRKYVTRPETGHDVRTDTAAALSLDEELAHTDLIKLLRIYLLHIWVLMMF